MTLRRIEPYSLEEELGRGSLGVVYLAVATDTVGVAAQPVAIKLFPARYHQDPEAANRYKNQLQLLRHIDHPAIVPVSEMGEVEGQIYLVMPYLAGGSLANKLGRGPLPITTAASLIQRLAPALDAAHAVGLVHGNLKPSNVLFNSAGEPRLSDFGMLIFAEAGFPPGGAVLYGPPAYFSPEQAQQRELDARSDVYMLGALLFELLTGQRPFQSITPLGLALQRIVAPPPSAVRLRPDLAPSWDQVLGRALAADPAARYASAGEFAAAIDSLARPTLLPFDVPAPSASASQTVDLDNTVNLAATSSSAAPTVASADPHQAATVAAGLASAGPIRQGVAPTATAPKALTRTPLPVPQAHPAARPARRKVHPALWLALVGLLLCLGLGLTGYLARGLLLERLPPELVAWLPAGATPTFTQPAASATSAASATNAASPTLTLAPQTQATPTQPPAATPTLTAIPATATTTSTPTLPPPTFTLSPSPTLVPTALPPSLTPLPVSQSISYTIQYNDTFFTIASQFGVDLGELIAINDLSCTSALPPGRRLVIPPVSPPIIPVRSPLTAAYLEKLELLHVMDCVGAAQALSFSPDGRLLAIGWDNMVYLWSVGDWKPVARLKGHTTTVTSIDFSSDSQMVVTGSNDYTVRLWQIDGTPLRTLRGHTNAVTAVAFSNDDLKVASAARDNNVRLWLVADGAPVGVKSGYSAFGVSFSPDGQFLAVGYANAVRLWRLSDLSLAQEWDSDWQANNLTYSPDGNLLASSSTVWEAASGRQIYSWGRSGDGVAFSPDGQLLMLGRRLIRVPDGGIWGTLNSPVAERERTNDMWDYAAISPDGSYLAWGSPDGVFIFGLDPAVPPAPPPALPVYTLAPGDNFYNVADSYKLRTETLLDANGLQCSNRPFIGQRLLIPESEPLPTLAGLLPIGPGNAAGLQELYQAETRCTNVLGSLTFNSTGQVLISGAAAWRVPQGTLLAQSDWYGQLDYQQPTPLLAHSPDGSLLAMRANRGVTVWQVSDGRLLQTLTGPKDQVVSLAFSSDSRMVAAGGGTGDANVYIWQVSDGALLHKLKGYVATGIAFTPDDQTAVTFGADAVRIWRLADDYLLHAATGVEGHATLSPDGKTVAYTTCTKLISQTCYAEQVNLYRVETGTLSVSMLGFTDQVQQIVFSPDSTLVAAASGNGVVVWRSSDGSKVHSLYIAGSLDDVTEVTFSGDGALVIAAAADYSLRIWETASGQLLHKINGLDIDGLAISPDNMLLAILAYGRVALWGIR